MGVYLGAGETVDDYSAMQGPCSSGFHIPLKSERQSVYSIWTALGGGASDGTNFGIALKLPFGGGRDLYSTAVFNNSEWGYYRSATADSGRAYALDFKSSSIDAQSYDVRAGGNQIRPFKNIPAIPTVSWTKLYGTSIEAGGIFWSSTDGLISLSSNGAKRITIADKNLGATTVWNSGDALSENNCGYFYQRGNNYGFQYTGTIPNQSSTQVNASAYGPGNYYSSDTFIKGAWNWDSSINLNLRGGETGIQPKTVYPELKNAYIGEYRVPGSNTLAYYPLTSTSQGNDMKGSGTAYNLSYSTQAPTYGVNAGVDCANMTDAMLVNYSFSYQISNGYTANCWFYMNDYTGGTFIGLDTFSSPSQGHLNVFTLMEFNGRPNSNIGFGVYTKIGGDTGISTGTHTPLSSWHNGVATYDGSQVKIYLDGVLKTTGSLSDTKTRTTLFLSWRGHNNNSLRGYMSNVILENQARTAQKISNYYNSTKGNYGL